MTEPRSMEARAKGEPINLPRPVRAVAVCPYCRTATSSIVPIIGDYQCAACKRWFHIGADWRVHRIDLLK